VSARLPHKATRDIAAQLATIGYSLSRRSGSGHLIFTHPCGARVVVSSTPSDRHAAGNVMCDARRAIRASSTT
jgi:predicted RNA binding protein YcfA (HicA-like mRNA interferase family)